LAAGDRAGAFVPPDGFNPAEAVLHHPWEAGRDAASASVVFDEEVAWIAERELGPSAAIERGLDGSITATVEIAEPAAFLGWLVGFEDRAEIVEPVDLRERYLLLVGGS
jgi:predicted DNA-binding transcriptional regulator YafY